MNTKKKALFLGVLASLFAVGALHANTYYIGRAVGAVTDTSGGSPLGGTIVSVDAGPTAPTSVWDLGGGTVTLPTGDQTFILQNVVFVRNGTLVIPQGTIVRGQPITTVGSTFDGGALAIAGGALNTSVSPAKPIPGKIIAEGGAVNPIIFTTASLTGAKSGGRPAFPTAYAKNDAAFWDANPLTAPRALVSDSGTPGDKSDDVSATGLWGGLIVLGNAPTNVDRNLVGGGGGAESDGTRVSFFDENAGAGVTSDDRSSVEGILTTSAAFLAGVDRFGGNNASDNSGVLRYISIRYGGSNLSTNSEINGLTLGGVGKGTIVDFIEIFGNTDDGIEVFGGTVNLKHCVVMGVEDDMYDFDAGYSGVAQFILGVGYGKEGNTAGTGSASADFTDRAFEWDGSYRQERPEGFRAAPAVTPAIVAGGEAGAVTSNQSPTAGNTVLNATIIGNVYTGPAISLASAGTAANNDRSRGLMVRDQAAPFLKNSIIMPTSYGLRVATMGNLNYTASIRRLESGRAAIQGNTFFNAAVGAGAGISGHIVTASGSTAAGTNNDARVDVAAATVAAVTDAASEVNLSGDPGFTISVNERLTTGSIDPRPTANFTAPGAPVAPVPAGEGIETVSYRGAFSDDGFSDLWTTGWTAANKLGLLVN